ncbi:hypothetical protein JAAARDRAFT_51886 [Jaapia argillacea MUCL 33604]|uniref:Uncharacterized protein n=1 Tax=Jaapia argillacea MUCL 33604 TaxID=933084 RepID=A0A067PF26_9AGAM|nr:hypothetical protein JAAARDRAFT_51886 [Jaapia argillacea MUCL 33604]
MSLLSDLSLDAAFHPLPSQSLSPQHDAVPSFGLGPGTNMDVIFQVFQISEAFQTAARFDAEDKHVLNMVQNHREISALLSLLGLPNSRADPKGIGKRMIGGGFLLRSEAVLRHFNWTMASYKHKSVWYAWCEDMAAMEWSFQIPSVTANTYGLYKTWCGIRFMWAKGGPIETGLSPKADNTGFDEQQGARLCQSHIIYARQQRTTLNLHLTTARS